MTNGTAMTTPTFEYHDRAWTRWDGQMRSDGAGRSLIAVAGRHDTSPTYWGPSEGCGTCWLGYRHSTDYHLRQRKAD